MTATSSRPGPPGGPRSDNSGSHDNSANSPTQDTQAASGITPGSDLSAPPPLDWLADILWPDGNVDLVHGAAAQGADVNPARRWWASPSAAGAEVLIPADIAAAKTAVRRYHDGFSWKKRARSWAAEMAMTVPQVADAMLSSALVVAVDHGNDRRADLLDQLGRLMGEPDLRFAVSLARPKSNRKPVLQLLTPSGATLGWAKIGWTGWTSRLVGNEAAWLEQNPSLPLVAPKLLHDVEISGHRVVVTSGVTGSRLPHRAPQSPDLDVVAAIAAMGTQGESRVAQTQWWDSMADVLDVADVTEARLIQAAVDATDHLDFYTGAWHGDLTPWNTMTTRRGRQPVTQVIDWEFAADGVPLGFDICHFHTQVAAELCNLSPDDAIEYSGRRSPQDLATLGVDADKCFLTWQLYLLELVRRTLALRKAGYSTDEVHQGRAALHRLKRIHGPEL